MDLLSPLLISVGIAGAKFLAKKWVGVAAAATGLLDGEVAGELAGGVIDCFKDKIKDVREQRKAARLFEDIGDKIGELLRPTFQEAIDGGRINVKDVTDELVETLHAHVTVDIFVKADLDPVPLTEALRRARPMQRGTFRADELTFYDRALAETVRYLVSTATDLPRFAEVFATESLTRLTGIKDDTRRLPQMEMLLNRLARFVEYELPMSLGTTQRIELSVKATHTPDDGLAARFEADYRHAVERNLDYLELFGADLSPEARRHSLSVAYVSLSVQRQTDESKEGTNLTAESLLDSLPGNGGRLLIRGEAGSGKSTLFRWAAIQAARMLDERSARERFQKTYRLQEATFNADDEAAFEATSREHWRNRIPFLIRLRDCTSGELPSPNQFPELVAKEVGHAPVNWVKDVLKQGRGLVLLDGVDEVANLDRRELYVAIKAIVETFPGCYFLVSTRPEAVEEGWLKRLDFREAAINPLTNVDREQFVDQWHEAVREELKRLGQPVDALSLEADSLKKKLKENATLARLATNPLMAAMICALHRRSGEHMPPSEAELVERLCFMLLDERDRLSGLKPEAYVASFRRLKYREKRAVVQELAYHMLVQRSQSSLDRDEAQQKVKERLELLQQSPDDAADVLRALIERSGMLRERMPPRTQHSQALPATIDFLHNTFKEYLAGTRLGQEGSDGLLAEHWDKSDWVPAILFAATVERSGFASQLIQKLLPDKDVELVRLMVKRGEYKRNLTKADVQTRRQLLLALRCRAVAWEVDPELAKQLQPAEEYLFPPRSMAEADALGEAGDAVLPFLNRLAADYDGKRNADLSAACIRVLRLIGAEATRPLLKGYIHDERDAVLAELCQSINPLEIPAVQRMVQESVSGQVYTKQASIRRQIVDLSPLAGLSGVTSLNLINTQVTDLSPLAGLSSLRLLDLTGTQVSDLSPVAGLSGLTFLLLSYTQVSDLSPLAGLSGLTSLTLGDTNVSDLSPLAGLSGLTSLYLRATQVSDLSPLVGLTKLSHVWVSDHERLTIPESLRGIVR